MKKVFAIAFIAVLAASCTKKPDHSLQDSNSMLQEPEVKVADTAKAKPAETNVAAPAAAAKTDSAATKK